jgi:hypothetical protein
MGAYGRRPTVSCWLRACHNHIRYRGQMGVNSCHEHQTGHSSMATICDFLGRNTPNGRTLLAEHLCGSTDCESTYARTCIASNRYRWR